MFLQCKNIVIIIVFICYYYLVCVNHDRVFAGFFGEYKVKKNRIDMKQTYSVI